MQAGADGRTVQAQISYFADAPEKPTFHAQDHRRDNWRPDLRNVTFHDARTWTTPPSLRREGIALAQHRTAIKNFEDRGERYAKKSEDI